MASALSPLRVPKHKGALPSHYYESFLEKKGPHDQHVEKLGLGAFVRLTDEAPWGSSGDPDIYFSLVLCNQEIKFKVESLESREMWKGFILTVVELRVPSNLTLLPGHLYMMAEALAKEEARRAFEVPSHAARPSCFLEVSRLEAQLLLERYPDCGNLLLRPSGNGGDDVSVTTRQTLKGKSVVRHYKVKREGPKYVIDVEEPFSCASLDAVINYFVSHTNNALVPFLLDEHYEKVLGGCGLRELGGPSTCLSGSCPHGPPLGRCPAAAPPLGRISVLGHVEADKENGESVWVARSTPAAPGAGPAPASDGPKQLPPVPITPVASQGRSPPLLNQEENYVIPTGDDPAATYVNGDVPSPSRPVPKPRKLAKVPKPPIAPKPGLADLTAELEEKLQRRRALERSAGHAGDQ
ncbi:hypothetical protein GH733_003844 [Mirounga leonina]|nr:hypothetical protein GH733_003844 [Mirounga leonina]